MVLLGMAVPLIVLKYALGVRVSKVAIIPDRGTDTLIEGPGAQALAVTYGFFALFCHFRWFWGLLPRYTVFWIGTALSFVGIVLSLGASLYFAFQYFF